MLNRLFPRQADNAYRGHVLGIWLLLLLALVKLLQGANIAGLLGTANTRRILEEADGVPIGTFPVDAAAHLLFLFSAWGLGVLTLSLLALVVLARYRAMVPLMYFAFLIEQLGRKMLSMVHLGRPFMSMAATPANLINWVFLLVTFVGFALSLSGRGAGKSSEPMEPVEG